MPRIDSSPSLAAPPGRILDIRLAALGHQRRKRQWVNHSFTVHALGLVVRGRGSYRAGSRPAQPITPGSLFAVYPGDVFRYGPEENTTWREYHVGGIGPGIERWQRYGWMPTDGRVRQIPPDALPAITRRFEQLLAACDHTGRGDADRAILLAERLLLELCYAASPHKDAADEDRIVPALREIRQRLAEPIDLEAIARKHHMSYSSFRQHVRQRTGLSPAKYLTELRCNAARRLLAETDQPIKQIATAVGYTDSPTFSKAFRRTVSVWPQTYRKQRDGMGA